MPIPARCYFYWSGTAFTFLNRLAVHSLLRKTPEAVCEVHYNQEPPPDNRHWNLLRVTPRVTLRKVNFPSLWRDCGLNGADCASASDGLMETHQSDLFRYCVLFSRGGVYADFDMIFVKELAPLLRDNFFAGFQINNEYPRLVNGAILGAAAQSPILRMAIDAAIRLLQKRKRLEWGELGPDLLTRILVKDCLQNQSLVRFAKIAGKLFPDSNVASDFLFRHVKQNHHVTLYHRNYFY